MNYKTCECCRNSYLTGKLYGSLEEKQATYAPLGGLCASCNPKLVKGSEEYQNYPGIDYYAHTARHHRWSCRTDKSLISWLQWKYEARLMWLAIKCLNRLYDTFPMYYKDQPSTYHAGAKPGQKISIRYSPYWRRVDDLLHAPYYGRHWL